MEWVTSPNNHPPATLFSNRRVPHTSGQNNGARIDQIAAQIQQLSQRLSKQSGQFSESGHQTDPEKPMTYKDVADMLTKTRDEGRLRKRGIMPKYPPEMDLVPYPPEYKPPTFQSYMAKSSAYQHIVHFKSQLWGIPDIDTLKIRSLKLSKEIMSLFRPFINKWRALAYRCKEPIS